MRNLLHLVIVILLQTNVFGKDITTPVFVENIGRIKYPDGTIAKDILFIMQEGNLRIDIKSDAICYNFFDRKEIENSTSTMNLLPMKGRQYSQSTTRQYIIEMKLIGANNDASILPLEEQPYYENVYTSSLSEKRKARSYSAILIKNIYKGIDWKIYTIDGKVKYDFIVQPNADINRLKMKYIGADKIQILDNGSLSISCPLGVLTEASPYTYDLNSKAKISSQFQLDNGVVSFLVDKPSDSFVIDPEISWCTYYGGTKTETMSKVINGPNGYMYLVGSTESSSGIASPGSHSPEYKGGTMDGILVCMDTSGQRIWATYFGGNGTDGLSGIAADKNGFLYVTGATNSTSGIATDSAFQTQYGGGQSDIVLAKFSNDGQLLWSTYYGGNSVDGTWPSIQDFVIAYITVSEDNSIYVSSITSSQKNIATVDAHQEILGGDIDVCLIKFDTSGHRIWGTYYGGSNLEYPTQPQTEKEFVYFGGGTESTSRIATNGSHQVSKGNGNEGFLAKMTSSGQRVWGTYFGQNGYDEMNNLITDNIGSIYCIGTTSSNVQIATTGTDQPSIGGQFDGFLVKFDKSGKRLWGTYIGGFNNEYFFGLKLDKNGNILVAGMADGSSDQLCTQDAFQPKYGGGTFDAIVAIYNTDGQKLFASYFGNKGNDRAFIILQDDDSSIFLAGETSSVNLSIGNVFQTEYGGGITDMFLMKFQYPDKLELYKNPQINEIGIYPNPVSEYISLLDLKIEKGSEFTIMNMDGFVVKRGEMTPEKILVNDLLSGNYLLRIKSNQKEYIAKFIKI
ncbi:MAG: T9SS type A sorting domain-containing protein [Saprospiraceae bacterium]|nr:T9SS type A sorting domain-containing protein [Saprospiraceae bacterium]